MLLPSSQISSREWQESCIDELEGNIELEADTEHKNCGAINFTNNVPCHFHVSLHPHTPHKCHFIGPNLLVGTFMVAERSWGTVLCPLTIPDKKTRKVQIGGAQGAS